MTRPVFHLVFCLLLTLALSGKALAAPELPKPTESLHVAMLWQQLAFKKMNAEEWVKASPMYNGTSFDRKSVLLDQQTPLLRNAFGLLSPREPIFLVFETEITGYTPATGTLEFGRFHKSLFFDYGYLGYHFALIPHRIDDYRQIRTAPELAARIVEQAGPDHKVLVAVTLIPTQADKRPMSIQGNDYMLLLASVSEISIWSRADQTLLWQSAASDAESGKSSLLQLYKP